MSKFCVFISQPRHDGRDAIVGASHHRQRCFKQLRIARKFVAQLTRKHPDMDVSLCRGARFCKHVPITKFGRRLVKTRLTRARRAAPDYIPF